MDNMFFLVLLLLLSSHKSTTEMTNRKTHCKQYGDTVGKWIYTKDIMNSTTLL